MRFPASRLLVLCKAPIPGRVNTRLIPHMGERAATELHAELARRMIQTCKQGRLAPIELWCEPDTQHPFFAGLVEDACRFAQQGADLGERMASALGTSLSRRGVASAVLVGTDCPGIDAAYLEAALRKLQDHDAVIGPAEDGGYGLIGLKRPNAELFRGIAWGGSSVCADTCRILNRQGLNWSRLTSVRDVDTPEDVAYYRQEYPR